MAASLSGIGDAVLNRGDKEKALAAYEEGVALIRELVDADANNLVWQRDLSISLNRVGDVKRDSGDTRARSPATTKASPSAGAWPAPIRTMSNGAPTRPMCCNGSAT